MTRPIATINPLVGDASFVARHGRLPTPADDDTERVATHVGFAEQLVRGADVSHLSPAQRTARAELLAVLRAYVAARRFPLGEPSRGRLPAFVDREGTRCAVAALVDHAAGRRASERIDARFHDAFVADIDDPALALLAAEAGLTRAELALIQPSYPPPPPAITYQVDATAEAAVASSPGDHPGIGLIGLGARWQGLDRLAVAEIDGDVGIDSSSRVPYAVEARIGTQYRLRPYFVGLLAGVRLDADGTRVPQAWTIPIDGYVYTPWGRDRSHHVGLVGGIDVRCAGADRALGWNVGLDVVRTREHDWHVKLGVEHVADLTFIAVTLGASTVGRFESWW